MLTSIVKFFRSLGGDRGGNVGLMFGLLAVPLTIAVGVSIDYGMASSARTKLQSALDAAVLAGAAASSTQTQTAAIAVAKQVFAADTSDLNAGASATFTFNASGDLNGTASYSLIKFFGGLTGGGSTSVGVVSEASASAGSPVCILLLSTTAYPGLNVNGGANVNATNCEIDSDSLTTKAASFSSGTNFTFSKICLEGTLISDNGGTHPNLALGCTTATNPYVGKLPAPPSTTCQYASNNYNTGTPVTLSPGVYCGGLHFNAATTVTLNPGVYVIQAGGWIVSGGTWNGTGVTFYFPDTSNIQFNSGMTMNLTAPTSGTYKGILIYEPDGLAESSWIWDSSISETLDGFIYLPSRDLTWNSPATVVSHQLSMIANSAVFNVVNWTLTPSTIWPITNTNGGGPGVALLK
ncbi:MAG: pilus assembly protein TadG-related protein [Roseiarcus sp.]